MVTKQRRERSTVSGDQSTSRRDLMMNEIYAQAMRLFSERGYDATTLQDIADAMGITRPALYYYVKSKDSLLERLVAETANAPMEGLQEIARRSEADPAKRLREAARLVTLLRARKADQYRVLERTEGNLPEPLATSFLEARRAVLREVASIVSDGMRAGIFVPMEEHVAALSILGMCNWVAWWYDPERGPDAEELAETIATLAVRSLERTGGDAGAVQGPLGIIARLRDELSLLERMVGSDVQQE